MTSKLKRRYLRRGRNGHMKGIRRKHLFEPLEDRRLMAVIPVDTGNDENFSSNAMASLRKAITAANAMPGPDEIVLDGFNFRLTRDSSSADDSNINGDLDIHDDLVIRGSETFITSIFSQMDERLFDIHSGNVTLQHMTLRGGSDDFGAAINVRAGATVTLESVIMESNTATGAGGGLFVESGATVNVSRSEFSENGAGQGGAIADDHRSRPTLAVDRRRSPIARLQH